MIATDAVPMDFSFPSPTAGPLEAARFSPAPLTAVSPVVPSRQAQDVAKGGSREGDRGAASRIGQAHQLCLDFEAGRPDPWEALNLEARPYQRRIVQQVLDLFSGRFAEVRGSNPREAESVLIESPTGSGKTVMGLTIARHLHRHWGLSVGWVAMRRNLLQQAQRENELRGFDLPLQLISMFDKQPPGVDLLIVDEAQHDAAMSMANLHCAVRPDKILGLTATPFRTDRIKLCFDRVIQDAGIHRLIHDGYLSPYHHYTIDQWTPQEVARCYLEDRKRWGKSLIFFHRQVQAEACVERLRGAGVRCDLVTGRSDRGRQLEEFAAGQLDVLVNMAVLTEGFDCPQLQTVFCRPSGRACTVQMAGRVFRKHPDLPWKQVVQCAQTRHPLPRTATPEQQYVWTGAGWRSLSRNPQIDEITRQSRARIAQAQVALPRLVAGCRQRRAAWPHAT